MTALHHLIKIWSKSRRKSKKSCPIKSDRDFTYGVRGCTCKMTSVLDSTHVKLRKNITGISVIDCDR